jgi:hypothetical protein
MESQAGPGFLLFFAVDIHAMRTFLRAHWKVLVAIVLLVLLALFTVNPGAAVPEISLASRLRSHVAGIGAGAHAARYIGSALETAGYAVRRQDVQAGSIEVSVSNLAPNRKPARTFIVGANGSANANGSAAVLELARLLKDLHPSQGTEVKFVFFADAAAPAAGGPDAGSFIAFVGTMESVRLVQDALSAFRALSNVPARGLAAPAYVQGMTLLDHASAGQAATPAVTITDTGFLRYPYYKMNADQPDTDDGPGAAPGQLDYEGTARVVEGLARTITALAAGAQG